MLRLEREEEPEALEEEHEDDFGGDAEEGPGTGGTPGGAEQPQGLAAAVLSRLPPPAEDFLEQDIQLHAPELAVEGAAGERLRGAVGGLPPLSSSPGGASPSPLSTAGLAACCPPPAPPGPLTGPCDLDALSYEELVRRNVVGVAHGQHPQARGTPCALHPPVPVLPPTPSLPPQELFIANSQRYVQETELSQHIRQWEEKMGPLLQEQAGGGGGLEGAGGGVGPP